MEEDDFAVLQAETFCSLGVRRPSARCQNYAQEMRRFLSRRISCAGIARPTDESALSYEIQSRTSQECRRVILLNAPLARKRSSERLRITKFVRDVNRSLRAALPHVRIATATDSIWTKMTSLLTQRCWPRVRKRALRNRTCSRLNVSDERYSITLSPEMWRPRFQRFEETCRPDMPAEERKGRPKI